MVSEENVLTTNSKCACGNGDTEHGQENHFENKCSTCGKEGTLTVETLDNVEQSDSKDNNDDNETEGTLPEVTNKIVCSNCGAEYCGQDGSDLLGGTRSGLNQVNPDEITGAEDEVSTAEEEDTTYMSGWEGLCDLLRPLDAEAMIVQRGDYVIVKKIDMPQTAKLWAYEGINVVDDSVSITDYTPEIYNTFVIRWGEEFENELEFTFNKHKQLFGERKQILEAKKEVPVSDEESEEEGEGTEGEETETKEESSGGLFSGITDMIFGTGGQKEKYQEKLKKASEEAESSDSSGDSEDSEKPETEEVPITTKEEAIQFGLKQVGKAKREDGHTVELKVIGNQNFMMGEWCHVKLPSFNEDTYMFISKCSFESSPDSEYINSLTLVDYPPSLGKVLGSSSSEEESSEDASAEETPAEGEEGTGTDGESTEST